MMTVLITGFNNHTRGIAECLRLNYECEEVRIIGTDCNAAHLIGTGCDKIFKVPRSDDSGYIPKMLEICRNEGVDVILPFVTTELHIMAANAGRFSAIGTRVSVSTPESLRVANNKAAMYERFYKYMPLQRVIRGAAGVADFAKEIGYPEKRLCCKLSESCGGNGFSIVDEKLGRDIRLRNKCGVAGYVTLDMMKELADSYGGGVILSEYVKGLDYSVCVLADRGKVLHECGYVGYEMDYGCVLLGEIMKNEAAYAIAEDVCENLGIDGNACFDFILRDNGSVKLLEVNPRLSASLAFVAKAGLNLPYLRCKQLMSCDVTKYDVNVKYGLKMRKYYECEYV